VLEDQAADLVALLVKLIVGREGRSFEVKNMKVFPIVRLVAVDLGDVTVLIGPELETLPDVALRLRIGRRGCRRRAGAI